ncbi:PLC-like phosphodiesterase [Xylariomycetidae sp. FL0641]|nr:PLC-like phosphodiesterase [Xylariomycetidae sp. FL0641]
MARRLGAWALLFAARALADTTIHTTLTSISDSRTTATDTTLHITENATPTGPYQSFASQESNGHSSELESMSDGTTSLGGENATETGTESTVTQTVHKTTVTFLTGSQQTTSTGTVSDNSTQSSTTTSSATPSVTNSQPCNNYPEFCNRKYGNITEISCHNSPFVTPNNVAANQQFDVTQQLNDGVRFLQAQIQWPSNGTEPHFCHTSCDILDAGPITDWLGKVKDWVASHPYDVVTILLGNGNYSTPDLYVPYIEQTGITRYIYTPPVVPMKLENWPTLGEMILGGKRVVMFMDYMANQTAYPWLLDEFSQMWETPFDPVDQDFPCTVQRPPNLAPEDANTRLSLINHNLNIQLSVLGSDMLVPARGALNVTNNNGSASGTLGLAADNCVANWTHAPTFLNVDYYNLGGFPGSVFEVAAQLNNVTYNRPCCGTDVSAANKQVLVGKYGTAFWVAAAALAWTLA